MNRFTSYIFMAVILAALYGGMSHATDSPRRIVSLGSINTENVFLLGAGNQLIANTVYCTFPEAAKHKEKIGTLLQVNVEKIISLKPDLVLATSLTRPRQVARLKQLGIRVEVFGKPASFSEICDQLIKLGRLLGREERAHQIINKAAQKVAEIKTQTSGLPRKKIFLQVGSKPLFASIDDSFTNDYIKFGGGINIAAGSKSGVYSREKVLEQNPDVIIIAMMGSEGSAGNRELTNWHRYQTINAVKTGNVHIVDPDVVCSPTPASFVKALKKIASIIHPDAKLE